MKGYYKMSHTLTSQPNAMSAYAAPGVRACLKPCPNTPNCVSTLAQDEEHRIAPIAYFGPLSEAKARLLETIQEMARTKIVEMDGDYIHVTFTSAIFRFVDDVEFVFDDSAKVIHFRSASRLGRSDLGANRRRMEQIRKAFGRS